MPMPPKKPMKPAAGGLPKFDPNLFKKTQEDRKAGRGQFAPEPVTKTPLRPKKGTVPPPKPMGRHGGEDAIKFMGDVKGSGDKPKGKKKK